MISNDERLKIIATKESKKIEELEKKKNFLSQSGRKKMRMERDVISQSCGKAGMSFTK